MPSPELWLRRRVLSSIHRSLAGEAHAQVRLICVEYSPWRISIFVTHHENMENSAKADLQARAVIRVARDMARAGRAEPRVIVEFARCDFPQHPMIKGQMVYGHWKPEKV
jgi:hypothetical protein